MNEFLVLLQAKLDEAKSIANLNGTSGDIAKLQEKLESLKLQVTLDPNAVQKLADDIGKLINQKIVISNIGIDTNAGIKAGQEYGKQVSQGISQGMSSASKSTEKVLRDFSELNDAKRKFVDGHDLISKDDIADAERLYDTVRKAFSEFGQVKITNEIFKDGILEKFKVNIEQVNGDLKETKSFIMALNDKKDTFVFSGLISGSENVVQHLDKAKNAVNQTADAINVLKEKAQIDKIQLSISDKGDTTTQIKTLSDNFTKLGMSADEVKSKMIGVDTEFAELKTLLNSSANNSAVTSQFDKLQLVLNETQNELKSTRSEYSLLVSAQQRLNKANTIEAWKQKNTAIPREALYAYQMVNLI